MTKEMLKMVKESKQRAYELIQYANPKSRKKPTIESVTDILSRSIPYSHNEGAPVITSISVTRYAKNSLIKSAQFRVGIATGKTWIIDAYQHLKGRTQEEREFDKMASFPSGLFTIFHKEEK